MENFTPRELRKIEKYKNELRAHLEKTGELEKIQERLMG